MDGQQAIIDSDGPPAMEVESTNNNVDTDHGKEAICHQTDDLNLEDGAASNLNYKIDKCIENLSGIDFDSNCLTELCTKFEWTANEQRLLKVVQEKSTRIKDLEGILRQKENEIAELKSHLDKFQSVFPFSRARKAGGTGNIGQRQRAQGISAEPQNETSVLEMLHVTFPKYEKDGRYVLFLLLLFFFVIVNLNEDAIK